MYNIHAWKGENIKVEKIKSYQVDAYMAKRMLRQNSDKFYGIKVYPWTNEVLRKYYNYENLTNKKSLCITSSGDHILHAVLAGSTTVDAVDVNALAKYYSALKIALIKAYDFSEFQKQFEDNCFIKSNICLDEISDFLTKGEKEFWKILLKDPNYYSLYRLDGFYTSIEDNCAYMDGKNYKKLKKNLEKATITYHDLDISSKNIHKRLDNTYDAIFSSNTYEYLKKIGANSFFKNCYNLLDKNGLLYIYHCINNPHKIENKYLEYEGMITTIARFEEFGEFDDCSAGVSIYKKID